MYILLNSEGLFLNSHPGSWTWYNCSEIFNPKHPKSLPHGLRFEEFSGRSQNATPETKAMKWKRFLFLKHHGFIPDQ
jgi:hypothetical protein